MKLPATIQTVSFWKWLTIVAGVLQGIGLVVAFAIIFMTYGYASDGGQDAANSLETLEKVARINVAIAYPTTVLFLGSLTVLILVSVRQKKKN